MTSPISFSAARIQAIRETKCALKRKVQSAVTHLYYNLLRGLPGERGFTARNKVNQHQHEALRLAAKHIKVYAKDFYMEPDMEQELLKVYRNVLVDSFKASASSYPATVAFDFLMGAMLLTPHGPNGTALSHGISCFTEYKRLIEALKSGVDVPELFVAHAPRLLAAQQPLAVMQRYLKFHDCGKAVTMLTGSKGNVRFPGHAAASQELWSLMRPYSSRDTEARLMGLDMLLHTASLEELAAVADDPLLPSLVLATYAQLMSNAVDIFGGRSSASTLKKVQAFEERAKALFALWGWASSAS